LKFLYSVTRISTISSLHVLSNLKCVRYITLNPLRMYLVTYFQLTLCTITLHWLCKPLPRFRNQRHRREFLESNYYFTNFMSVVTITLEKSRNLARDLFQKLPNHFYTYFHHPDFRFMHFGASSDCYTAPQR